MRTISRSFLAASLLSAFFSAAAARADEGMWLVNKPPLETLKSKYDFVPSAALMEHLQKSAVNPGASGSFVSKHGLVMTNHHVASDAIAKLSTAEHNYMDDGFYAPTFEAELKCADTEITMLVSIQDVTDKVKGAVKPNATPAEAGNQRREAIAAITKEEQAKTGLQCRVVTLYQGGLYHLYSSKRFTDVRLVFAPEQQAAFYGGDTDNFEYPRHDFDVSFFRVYENGKPYQPEHFLAWSPAGAKDGELALVFGHPGRTQRLLTTDHLRFIRDVGLPASLANLWRMEMKLQAFAGRSAENARIAREDLFGVANSRKALTGQLSGLQDPAIFGRKVEAEKTLRAAIEKNPEWKAKWGAAFDKVSTAYAAHKTWVARRDAVSGVTRGSIAGTALSIALFAEEKAKPNGERFAEFSDANLASTEFGLYSPAPIYDTLEVDMLASSLAHAAERLGAEDPLVVALLAGKSPRARAQECISGTTIKDPAARKKLVEGGIAAVRASSDPLIKLALAVLPEARELRKKFEDEVQAVERNAYADLAAARFAIDGDKVYPDATGTLRMSFGPIKGYTEDGKQIPPFTTFASLYEKAAERAGNTDFVLTKKWQDAKAKLNPATPMNFVCTADIIGGNSGSPVVNTKGEVIGLIFDGNIQSLPGAFAYDDTQNRAVAVDSRALLEGFKVVYNAKELADELTGKR